MNTRIDRIAKLCHEANRAYCELNGDFSQLPYNEAPDSIIGSAEDGVQAIIDGAVTSPQQLHENWLKFKEVEGWTYGPVKDFDTKKHPCMLPYSQLPLEQKIKDYIFFSIVKACIAVE